MNFVPAVAYLFCLNLPAAFSQPGNGLIEIDSLYKISLPIIRPLPSLPSAIRVGVHGDSVLQRVGDALRLLVARHSLGVRLLDGDRGLPGAHYQNA